MISERVSGSTWLENVLKESFPSTKVSDKCWPEFKHFFNYPDIVRSQMKDTDLVIVNTRNAVDWILHFWKKPWNARAHANLTLAGFLARPWNVEGSMHPTNTEQGMWSLHRRPLVDERERYQVYQIKDVYEEYDHAFGGDFPEGPIANVIQLRAMKLDNFLRLRDWDARNLPSDPPHIVYVRYEDLIANAGQGMRNLLQAFRCRYNFTKVEKAEVLVDHYKGYKNVPVNLTEEELLNVYIRKNFDTKILNSTIRELLLTQLNFEQERKFGYNYAFLWRTRRF